MKRTPLARKTPLSRGSTPLRRTPLARVSSAKRTVAKQRRQRDTGPDEFTKALLWERARGHCELCGRDLQGGFPFSRHHRRPRGMGGSREPWVNELPNLLLVCGSATTPGGCHLMIEAGRQAAYDAGWLIPYASRYLPHELPALLWIPSPFDVMQHVDDGANLTYQFTGAVAPDLVYLTLDGRYEKGIA